MLTYPLNLVTVVFILGVTCLFQVVIALSLTPCSREASLLAPRLSLYLPKFTYAAVAGCCLGLLKVELPLAQDRLFLTHKYTPFS